MPLSMPRYKTHPHKILDIENEKAVCLSEMGLGNGRLKISKILSLSALKAYDLSSAQEIAGYIARLNRRIECVEKKYK